MAEATSSDPKPGEPIEIKSTAKNAQDLEALIKSNAAAASAAKTPEPSAPAAPTTQAPTKVSVQTPASTTQNAAPKPVATAPAPIEKAPAPAQKIAVNKTPAVKPAGSSTTETPKKAAKASTASAPTEEAKDAKTTLSRRGKTIQPISTTKKADSEAPAGKSISDLATKTDEETDKDADDKSSDKPDKEAVTKEADSKEQAQDEAGDKLQAMSSELRADAEAKAKAKDQQQEPKVFDTTQYHLPIKATRVHRQHDIHPLLIGVIVTIAIIIAGVVATDLELIDPGFDLPFDLL